MPIDTETTIWYTVAMNNLLIQSNSLYIPLADQSVNCVVTSPPYYGLRDYGVDGQIGLEQTPDEYVQKLVDVFRECKRVLRDDGTLWLNLGDSYNGSGKAGNSPEYQKRHTEFGKPSTHISRFGMPTKINNLKPKDLIGIPWRVAFALQADGWYLRSDIIWAKPNPMPESVKDRPTRSHEYIFLLSKSQRYYYDYESIKEVCVNGDPTSPRGSRGTSPNAGRRKQDCTGNRTYTGFNGRYEPVAKRNKRDVWTVTPKPYRGAHYATFPPDLILPCILAGCHEGGIVLDPFVGSGTTVMVANQNNRNGIGLDLSWKYLDENARVRVRAD